MRRNYASWTLEPIQQLLPTDTWAVDVRIQVSELGNQTGTSIRIQEILIFILCSVGDLFSDHYPNATISFLSLGNIHAIASSHQALLKAISTQADSPNWYTVLESTGWLSHVSDLLKAAAGRDGIVEKMVGAQSSVLVVGDSSELLA